MNKQMLTGIVYGYGDTYLELADYLGINNSTLSLKINGKAEFTQREIYLMKIRYKFTSCDIDAIFFNN